MLKQQYKSITLKVLGLFFILISIIAITYAIFNGKLYQLFWICYIAILLIGIGILTNNSYLIITQINILFIPLIIWNIDFSYLITTKTPLWGITDYFFVWQNSAIGKFISLQHVYTIPLALLALYFIKIKRKDTWKISLLEITLIFILTKIFTAEQQNINCVFNSCIPLNTHLPYNFTWFICFFIIILFTNFIINLLPFLKDKY